jgi:hypothetical protein
MNWSYSIQGEIWLIGCLPKNEWFMRKLQITIFIVATLALMAAAGCIGKQVGTELRNAGIAALLFDVVCIQLWPAAKRHQP